MCGGVLCRVVHRNLSNGLRFVQWFLVNESGQKCAAAKGGDREGLPGHFVFSGLKPFVEQSPFPKNETSQELVEKWLHGFLKPQAAQPARMSNLVKITCALVNAVTIYMRLHAVGACLFLSRLVPNLASTV